MIRKSASAFPRSLHERSILLALTLAAAALRFWAPGAKGLWYDESLTAAMTQLSPAEIVRFHWQAAFTHLPGWYLFTNGWARVFGTSEYALRLPSVMAGIAAVPLFWQLLRTTRPSDRGLRLIATALLVGSPLLVLYSQEARMYSLALALALASFYLFVRLTTHEQIGLLIALLLVNWAMIALQYYYALLIGIEGLFLTLRIIRRRSRPLPLLAVLVASLLPLLWRGLSPGFWGTANALATSGHNTGNLPTLLDAAWRDLTFGMVIWRPPQAAIGYLLVAPALMGLIFASRRRAHLDTGCSESTAIRWPGLFLLTIFTAGSITALLPEHFQIRYVLYIAPLLLAFIALGIVETWRRLRPAGALLFVATLAVAGSGLYYYFTAYQRSEYREMARYLGEHAHPGSVVLLEGPRQHLLADYYLPKDLKFEPIPDVPLPAHLPVDAPLVVPAEVDRQLKPLLEAEPELWLILAGENEVDPGEFVLS
ncbi:MAG: glycosyltransferase family 39 protein, partial [Anaerolineae bacterium]